MVREHRWGDRLKKRVFIAQPFDGQKYDQRYRDEYEPAILAAGFEPYRVDRDASASIPIDEIERNIESSLFVFSDISEDNPNVWFEVGYAIAKNKEICFVCSRERLDRSRKFPFDIQHRNIIIYDSNSRSDWDKLAEDIAKRIAGIGEKIEKNSEIREVLTEINKDAGSSVLGLSEIERVGFAIVASVVPIGAGISEYEFAREMEKSGYNGLATNVSVRRLMKEQLVQKFESESYNGEEFIAYRPTDFGWGFLEKNLSAFKLKNVTNTDLKSDPEIPF